MIITCACRRWKHTAGNQQTQGLQVLGGFRGITEASTAILEVARRTRVGGLKEQVQQSVNFSEHANHETGHSRLRNIVTTWRLNEPSLPD